MTANAEEATTVPLSDAIAAITRNLGFPEARVRTVSRALQERSLFPVGGPGKAPMATLEEIVTLIVGLASDRPLHETPETIKAFDALRPEGMTPAEDLPRQLSKMDHDPLSYLDFVADELASGDNYFRKMMIEVVAEPWPEIALRFPDGTVRRYFKPGSMPGHWLARGYRKSITLNGAALGDVMLDLFGSQKADAA